MRSTLEPSAPSCCESASVSEVTSAAGPIAPVRSELPSRLCENGPVEASNFALTDVQRQFRDTLRQYAEERIAPQAAEVDRTAEFPWKSFKACVEL